MENGHQGRLQTALRVLILCFTFLFRPMIRKSTLLLAVVLGLQAEAQTITSVTTSPTPLTECSLVTLTTNGMLPNGIAPTNFSPGTQVGNNIPLTIFAGWPPPKIRDYVKVWLVSRRPKMLSAPAANVIWKSNLQTLQVSCYY